MQFPDLFHLGIALIMASALSFADSSSSSAGQGVREPAVAGLFYSKSPSELSALIADQLTTANPETIEGELKALICPHAGYRYSGPVAASAYRLVKTGAFGTVVILAPSHTAYFSYASVSAAKSFRTPLGDVPVAVELAAALGRQRPFGPEAPTLVQRPEWWREASCPAPAVGDDTPHTWEHAAEVQVPFLQKTLREFHVLPVIMGDVDPVAAAAALDPLVDDKTLIVASSDLSHYDSYANARQRDLRCLEAICALNPDAVAPDDACGAIPIRTLLCLAKTRGWKARLLDYRNSGDTTGDKNRGVVGYAAVAFFAPAPSPESFRPDHRRILLDLARQSLRAAVADTRIKPVTTAGLAPALLLPRGCFVTLTENGVLRGCIGNILPHDPLALAVAANARSAAREDPRFSPVAADEVDRIRIEISVLTEPEPLVFRSPDELLEKLQPGRDGIVLQIGTHTATYLPQVWDDLPDKTEFLDSLARKAGCSSSAWRGDQVKVFRYRVESFKEPDAGL